MKALRLHAGIRPALASFMAIGLILSAAGIASAALPSTTPDDTLGTDGKVREIVQVGNVLWVGGRFSALVDRKGNVVEGGLNNLAALDATTGRVAQGVDVPDLTGSNAIVYDLSTDGSEVYAAGTFQHSGGSKNLVEFDGLTGQVGNKFSAPALKTVLVDGNLVLGGGKKMSAWNRDGQSVGAFVTTVPLTNPALRAHNTPPMYTDIAPMPGGGWLAACKCDWVLNPGETTGTSAAEKAIVRLLPDGTIDHSWNKAVKSDSAAFGWHLALDTDGVVLAAGGSDFTQKLTYGGQQIWKTDTDGSSQTVIRYGDRYIVGGHFRCVGNSVFHPRLVALTLSGERDPSWVVPVTNSYNGIWALHSDGHSLWVGGEFTRLGGTWSPASQPCGNTKPTATGQTPQRYLGRFS